MRNVTLAATQMSCSWDVEDNLSKAERLVREAAGRGANIVLIQELFATPYFCQDQSADFFDIAQPLDGNPIVERFSKLAAELNVVLPVSYFEQAGKAYFNSVAIVDAGGAVLGNYRKSHIPDGTGYTEKFYFSPGDTGFRAWKTRFATIGVGICWDQWYPEAARAMALLGAEILMYPTAIGSEPHDAELDTAAPWQRIMQAHAVANVMPVIASNRIGTESLISPQNGAGQTFYGHSFIANHRGDKVAEFGAREEGVLVASFDLDYLNTHRAAWGFFRDRRPELYTALASPRPA